MAKDKDKSPGPWWDEDTAWRRAVEGWSGEKVQKPEPPPLPPEMLAQIQAATTEWKVALGPAALEDCTKPTTYLVTANGTMVVKKVGFGRIVAPLGEAKPLIPSPLVEIPPQLHLAVPRLPWETYRQIVAFFREVAKKDKTEVLVRVFVNPDQTFHVHVPEQRVSGGGVTVLEEPGEGYDANGEVGAIHLLDIHSHVDMPAFFSGTDDKDESTQGIRLFGVIGKLTSQTLPASSWRVWTGSGFMKLGIEQVVEIPTTAVRYKFEATLQEMITEKVTAQTIPPLPDFFADATFPEEWLKPLQRQVFSQIQSSIAGFTRPPSQSPLLLSGETSEATRLGSIVSDARAYLARGARRLAYLVRQGKVMRIEDTGALRPTSMTLNQLYAMRNQRPAGQVIIYSANTGEPDLGFKESEK